LRKVRDVEDYTADIRDSVQLPHVLADVVMSYVNVPEHMRRGGVSMKRDGIISPVKKSLQLCGNDLIWDPFRPRRSIYGTSYEIMLEDKSMISVTAYEFCAWWDDETSKIHTISLHRAEWVDFMRGWPRDAFTPQIPGVFENEYIEW
jgi:hypothetical protein